MRLYRYLTELFQEKRDGKIRMEMEDHFVALFEVNQNKGKFIAEYLPDTAPQHIFGELVFEDQHGRMEVTELERENAIEVFSYVISITKYFLKEYQPDRVKFGGFEIEQQKLYKRMVKRYKKEIEKLGYEVEDHGEFSDIILKKRKK